MEKIIFWTFARCNLVRGDMEGGGGKKVAKIFIAARSLNISIRRGGLLTADTLTQLGEICFNETMLRLLEETKNLNERLMLNKLKRNVESWRFSDGKRLWGEAGSWGSQPETISSRIPVAGHS